MSKLSNNLYLHRSEHYIYYYRRAIPDYLRKHFGLCEIKKSLKTRDKSTAIMRYCMMASQVELMFYELKGGAVEKNVDPTFIISIKKEAAAIRGEGEATAVMSGVVQALRGQALKLDSGRIVEDVLIKLDGNKLRRLDGSEVDEFTIVNALAYADSVGIPKMVDESQFVSGEIKASVSWHEPTKKEKLARAKEERKKLEQLGLLDAVVSLSPDAALSHVAAPVVQLSQEVKAAPVSVKTKKRKRDIRFSKMVDEYLIYRTNLKEATKAANRKIFGLFQEIYGDIMVSEFDHFMVTEFIETLKFKIPANIRKSFPHHSMQEIMAMNHKKAGRAMMSIGNINKYLSRLSGLLKYAVNRGYIEENYALNKREIDPEHAKDKRARFNDDEISKLFSQTSPWAENDRKKPESFWIDLIGAFTGARLGEICQLRTSDIREITQDRFSGWVIDINRDGYQKNVKNRNAIRLVPIHSKLIELGFLDYVKKRRQDGCGQLWDLEPDEEGNWSNKMSKRIIYLHNKAGIKKPFHSWRHTVCDVLMKNDDVRIEEQNGFVGHVIKGEGTNRYGKGLSLSILKHTAEGIHYDSLDLSHLIKK